MQDLLSRPGWLADPWWEQPKYVGDLPQSPDEIKGAITCLEKYFDARWWSGLGDDAYGNVVARNLLIRGSEPACFLIYLSGVLSRVDRCVGFPSKLRDLKGAKSESVLLELEMAALYAAAGWEVSFPREGTERVPDVLVRRGDDEVAIECKGLDEEAWEVWADNLTNQVLFTPPIGGRDERYTFQIELGPRLADLRLNPEQYPKANAALREGIVQAIRDTLVKALDPEPALPLQVPIPGIGRVTVLPKSGGQSWISGPEISSEAKLRRIFTNGVIPSCEQLPAAKPGIVVVCAEHLGEAAAARLMLDSLCSTDLDRFGRLAGVLLMPLRFIFGTFSRETLLANRYTRFDGGGVAALDVLRNALNVVET